jgi:hypothetical protein
MTGVPPPDPLESSRLAEAILAIERRVAILEKENRPRMVEVKRPRLALTALLVAIIGFLFARPYSRDPGFFTIAQRGAIYLTQPCWAGPSDQAPDPLCGIGIGYRWVLVGCALAGAASLAIRRNRA